MNTKLMAGVSILALGLAGCGANNPEPLVMTPMIKYKMEKVEAAVSVIPDWYKELPSAPNTVYTVGSGTAADLQMAVDIATLNGKIVLADRINGKLKAMTKSWVTKIGQSDDGIPDSILSEIEKTAKNVIANVDVAGYNPVKVDVSPAGTQYRAFVLLEYNDKNARKIIMNRLQKDRMVYSRLRSNKAWKELENEVYKSEKSDEAKSMANIEKLIPVPVTPVDEAPINQ